MQCRNIVVVAASAGGIEALQQIVSHLPATLAASLFVTVHFPETGTSLLPQILSRAGQLSATHATDGERIVPGRIYVAPPDFHLLMNDSSIRLSRGPRENGHRPAADPMFRSAAVTFGARVIGVVLSGNQDDGTSGLAAIKRYGGLTLVQDPAEALFNSMPRSAIEHVRIDRVATARELGKLIVDCAADPVEAGGTTPMVDDAREDDFAAAELHAMESPEDHPGQVSPFSCPDCGGVLWQIQEGDFVRFRCRVGHGWTADALIAEQADQVDDALWAALRALEERAALLRSLAARYQRAGNKSLSRRFEDRADQTAGRARLIRDLLVHARGLEGHADTEERANG